MVQLETSSQVLRNNSLLEPDRYITLLKEVMVENTPSNDKNNNNTSKLLL